MQFSWDKNKQVSNLKKHGFDFIDAAELFDGKSVYTYLSPRENELRFVSVGVIQGVFVAVVWMEREETIRIISFRRARDGEKRMYRKLFG